VKYGVEVGQIWVAADGSKCGHLVTDITTFAYCDDVVTCPFRPQGITAYDNRIDVFKLAQVRYYLPEVIPEWVPKVVMEVANGLP